MGAENLSGPTSPPSGATSRESIRARTWGSATWPKRRPRAHDTVYKGAVTDALKRLFAALETSSATPSAWLCHHRHPSPLLAPDTGIAEGHRGFDEGRVRAGFESTVHSADTLARRRKRNFRAPSWSLMIPKTGPASCFLSPYACLASSVSIWAKSLYLIGAPFVSLPALFLF